MTVLATLICFAARAGLAQAHGPSDPVASSYLARLGRIPAGLQAKVVDADERLWLSVPRDTTVVVLDYRGAPYLRFTRAGVQVNENSSMYYLNQTPVAQTPPASLTARTPPSWHAVSGGHTYVWQDGRLHALTTVALAPGTTYAGRWSIPLLVGGRLRAVSGGVWYSPRPSLVWFWAIAVVILCALAAWRVRRPALDARVARWLGIVALIGTAVAGAARELYGRPTISILQLVELALVGLFVAWGVRRVVFERPGYFSYFVIAFVALWQGFTLIPTLLHGFVLAVAPAFVARAAAVLCLSCGASMVPLVGRLADRPEPAPRGRARPLAQDGAAPRESVALVADATRGAH